MNKLKLFFFATIAIALCLSCRTMRAQSGTTYRQGRRITCASDDGGRHFCPIRTHGDVRIVNQRSGSPCVQGRTWGFDNRGIWVTRGCRADFIVAPRMHGGPVYPGPGGPPMAMITCSSNNGGRQFCPADTRRGVRMVNQRSGSPCVAGRTWGYTHRGIWVDRGCRADFALGRR